MLDASNSYPLIKSLNKKEVKLLMRNFCRKNNIDSSYMKNMLKELGYGNIKQLAKKSEQYRQAVYTNVLVNYQIEEMNRQERMEKQFDPGKKIGTFNDAWNGMDYNLYLIKNKPKKLRVFLDGMHDLYESDKEFVDYMKEQFCQLVMDKESIGGGIRAPAVKETLSEKYPRITKISSYLGKALSIAIPFLFVSASSLPSAAGSTYKEKAIADTSDSEGSVDAYGNNLVWFTSGINSHSGYGDIGFYNKISKEKRIIDDSSHGLYLGSSVRIWNDKVVYEKYTSLDPWADTDINIYNVTSLTKNILSLPGNQEYSDIYDNNLTFLESHSLTSSMYDIFYSNISTPNRNYIAGNGSMTDPVTEPRIFQDNIFWHDQYGNIYEYNITANKIKMLADSGNYPKYFWETKKGNFLPVADEDHVAWIRANSLEYLNTDIDLVLYDRLTDKEIIADKIANGKMSESGISKIDIDKHNIIYGKAMPSEFGIFRNDIFTYNKTNGLITQITDNIREQCNPTIFGDNVAWEDRRNSEITSSDIWGLEELNSAPHLIDYQKNIDKDNKTVDVSVEISDDNPITGIDYNVYLNGTLVQNGSLDGEFDSPHEIGTAKISGLNFSQNYTIELIARDSAGGVEIIKTDSLNLWNPPWTPDNNPGSNSTPNTWDNVSNFINQNYLWIILAASGIIIPPTLYGLYRRKKCKENGLYLD